MYIHVSVYWEDRVSQCMVRKQPHNYSKSAGIRKKTNAPLEQLCVQVLLSVKEKVSIIEIINTLNRSFVKRLDDNLLSIVYPKSMTTLKSVLNWAARWPNHAQSKSLVHSPQDFTGVWSQCDIYWDHNTFIPTPKIPNKAPKITLRTTGT